MTLIADIFWKLRTQKTVVRLMYKKSRFWRSFEKQHRKQAQKLFKSQPQHLCIFIHQCERNWIGKSLS